MAQPTGHSDAMFIRHRGALTPMKLKEISLEQRPRERLRLNSVRNLSDSELLALILENGTTRENVIDLSNRLIPTFGLDKLNSLSLQQLVKIKGIGPAKASKLIASFELSKRIKSGVIYGKRIKNPSDIASYYIMKLKDLRIQ
jgi:DNA repair protein RadC